MGRRNTIFGVQHFSHDFGGQSGLRHDGTSQGKEHDFALKDGLNGDAAGQFADFQGVSTGFGDFVTPLSEESMNVPQAWGGRGCHRLGKYSLIVTQSAVWVFLES